MLLWLPKIVGTAVPVNVRTQLERVFSDADVVDIDLGDWSTEVRLIVVADHFREHQHGLPIVCVRFLSVTKFHIEVPPGPVERTWHIYAAEFGDAAGLALTLSGHASSPRLVVHASDAAIVELDSKDLDRRFPGWRRRHGGLRPPV